MDDSGPEIGVWKKIVKKSNRNYNSSLSPVHLWRKLKIFFQDSAWNSWGTSISDLKKNISMIRILMRKYNDLVKMSAGMYLSSAQNFIFIILSDFIKIRSDFSWGLASSTHDPKFHNSRKFEGFKTSIKFKFFCRKWGCLIAGGWMRDCINISLTTKIISSTKSFNKD